MTDLQQRISDCLHVYSPFPLTSQEIAAEIGFTPRQVANSLCWMRGAGLVTDGSVVTPIPNHNAALWSRPKGPIRWALK